MNVTLNMLTTVDTAESVASVSNRSGGFLNFNQASKFKPGLKNNLIQFP